MIMEKTEKQWQKLGFTPKDGIKGVQRTQQFGSKYIYLQRMKFVR